MNELQQVLIIFAVVVIAGLYFLSRSRQDDIKKSSVQSSQPEDSKVKESRSPNPVLAKTKTTRDDIEAEVDENYAKASAALNNLGEKHEPISAETEQRIIAESQLANQEDVNQKVTATPTKQTTEELYDQNQGMLSFGEEFDIPPAIFETKDEPQTNVEQESVAASTSNQISTDHAETKDSNSEPFSNGGKHHVLVVDDPGLNGEIDESTVPVEAVKPTFGIPGEDIKIRKVLSGTNKEPQAFVIMMLSTGQEFAMVDINQALRGVGLTYSEQSIYAKTDNMGKPFIKVANVLEPGIFPSENLESYTTPGVVMILELPTTVRAPAAMDDLILMARKISQRLGGRLYDMDRHLISESDIQNMRDTALDYESEPL